MRLAPRLLSAVVGRRKPRTRGVETLPRLRGPVTIRRDRWHVPHIEARHEEDAWFALGFCQGQDRTFQLELLKRIASGRLSALVGPDGVAIDRLMRRLGLRRAARASIQQSRPRVRTAMEAFAAGIGTGTGRVGSPRRPPAMALLGADPSPHDAADVMATFKLLGFVLSANWYDELIRLQVLVHDGPEALARLDPAGASARLPATWPPGEAAGPALEELQQSVALLRGWVPVGGASNCWALDGSRTANGRPLLANDPHLPATLPSWWYLAHVTTPEWSVAGATVAGTPAFAAGHNHHGAWGVTAGHADETDLFLQLVRGRRVWTREGWRPAELRREHIAVRFGADLVEEVLVTPQGPIISPALRLTEGDGGLPDGGAPPAGADPDDGRGPWSGRQAREGVRYALSLRGMPMEPGPIDGFVSVPAARSLDDFRDCFRQWRGMSLSLVWADTSGTVGWQLVGELPVRGVGEGTLPLPAWGQGVGWTGRVPYQSMPHGRDPDSGLLATANNQPVPRRDAAAFLGLDFLDGYRLAAIMERLGERRDWDLAATQRLQRDTWSVVWRDLGPTVLVVDPRDDEDAATALRLLRGWDGHVEADSSAATVFELLLAELTVRVVEAAAPGAAGWVLGRSPIPDLLPHTLPGMRNARTVELVREQPDGWFPEGWPAMIRESLGAAVRRAQRRCGPDPAGWTWRRARPVHLRHQLSNAVSPLGAVFDRGPLDLGGDGNTIPGCSTPPTDPLGDPVAIPSLRMVVDVGEWSASRWSLPGGQSGNPLSPHYDDLVPHWETAEGIPIAWDEEEVEAATQAVLRLLPTGSG